MQKNSVLIFAIISLKITQIKTLETLNYSRNYFKPNCDFDITRSFLYEIIMVE